MVGKLRTTNIPTFPAGLSCADGTHLRGHASSLPPGTSRSSDGTDCQRADLMTGHAGRRPAGVLVSLTVCYTHAHTPMPDAKTRTSSCPDSKPRLWRGAGGGGKRVEWKRPLLW